MIMANDDKEFCKNKNISNTVQFKLFQANISLMLWVAVKRTEKQLESFSKFGSFNSMSKRYQQMMIKLLNFDDFYKINDLFTNSIELEKELNKIEKELNVIKKIEKKYPRIKDVEIENLLESYNNVKELFQECQGGNKHIIDYIARDVFGKNNMIAEYRQACRNIRSKCSRHNLHYGGQGWDKLSNIKPTKAINTNFGIGRKS